MEEELKRVECLIERCNQCKLNACITCDICWSEVQAIKEILEQNKELEEENAMLKKAHNISEKVTVEDITQVMNKSLEDFKKEFIPTSVIQNKLEKLKREFNFYAGREHFEWQDGEFDGEVCDDIALKIGVLKELLEEGRI